MPYLKLIKGRPAGHVFDIRGDRAVIGRHDVCDICTQNNSVSRKHAVIELQDGEWFLRDLGSSNGSRVNDAEAPPSTGIRLHDRDRICLAELMFTFHETEPAAVAETVSLIDAVEILQVATRKSLSIPRLPADEWRQDARWQEPLDEKELNNELANPPIDKLTKEPISAGVHFHQTYGSLRRVVTFLRDDLAMAENELEWLTSLLDCTDFRGQLIHFGRAVLKEMNVACCTIMPIDAQSGEPANAQGVTIRRTYSDTSDQPGRVETPTEAIHPVPLAEVQNSECAVSYTVSQPLSSTGSGFVVEPHMLAPIVGRTGNRRGVVHCTGRGDDGNTLNQGGYSADELNRLYWKATVFSNVLKPSSDRPELDASQEVKHQPQVDQFSVRRPQRPNYEFFDFDIRSDRSSDLFMFEETTPDHVAMVLLFRWHNEDDSLYRMQVFSREIPLLLKGIDSAERAMELLKHGFSRLKWDDQLAAMVAIVDTKAHIVKVARAGMRLAPLVKDSSGVTDVELLETPPFGVDLDESCSEKHFTLLPGQSLIMFSDGILSAELRSGEIVNSDRVRTLANDAPLGAQELGKSVHDSLSLDLREDVSFMVAHRTA